MTTYRDAHGVLYRIGRLSIAVTPCEWALAWNWSCWSRIEPGLCWRAWCGVSRWFPHVYAHARTGGR